MLIHAQPNYVLRCSKLFKFSFGMGLMVDLSGSGYSKLPNVKKKTTSIFLHMRETLKTTISVRFFIIPGRNLLKTFLLTHFFIVNFALESKFEVNWTPTMLKDA